MFILRLTEGCVFVCFLLWSGTFTTWTTYNYTTDKNLSQTSILYMILYAWFILSVGLNISCYYRLQRLIILSSSGHLVLSHLGLTFGSVPFISMNYRDNIVVIVFNSRCEQCIQDIGSSPATVMHCRDDTVDHVNIAIIDALSCPLDTWSCLIWDLHLF